MPSTDCGGILRHYLFMVAFVHNLRMEVGDPETTTEFIKLTWKYFIRTLSTTMLKTIRY